MIHACSEAGEPQRAEDWLRKMSKDGMAPTPHSYNNVMHAWGVAGNSERAQEFFEEMRKNGVKGSVVSYSSLLRPHARKGNYQEAERLMQAMKEDGIRGNEFFLNQVLCSYANASPPQPDRAEIAFREAVKQGVKMNEFLHTSVRKALGKERAEGVLAELGLPVTFERTAAGMSGGKYGNKGQSNNNQGENRRPTNSSANSNGSSTDPNAATRQRVREVVGLIRSETNSGPIGGGVRGRGDASPNWRNQ